MATQIQLANMAEHVDFQRRVRYLMVKAAVAKLNAEAPSSADILLGQRILDGGESVYIWSLGVLTNPTIAAGAHEPDGSSIVEGDMEFAVNSLWLAFSM